MAERITPPPSRSLNPLLDDAEVFAAIPVPATLIDAEGIIVDVNPAFVAWARDFGYEVAREERLGHPLEAFANSVEHRAQILALVDEVLSGRNVTRLKERFSDENGRAIHAKINANPVRNTDGVIVGAIVLREDVTEEVRRQELRRVLAQVRQEVDCMTGSDDMERVLIAVRDGLRQVAPQFSNCGVNLVEDGAPPGVLQHSMTGGGRWMRPQSDDHGAEIVVRIWGGGKTEYRSDLDVEDEYSEAENIQSDFGERIRCVVDVPFSRGTLAVNSTRPGAFTAEDIEAFEAMARMLSAGFTRMEDFRHLETRNRALEVEVAGRKRAQRTLRESEARYRDLVENMPIALSHTTPDGQLIYQNPAAEEIHGYSAAELSRLRPGDLYQDPDDWRKFLRVLREQGVYAYEHKLRHKSGHTVWVRGTTRAMRDGEGEIIFFHGIAEDITGKKRAESMRLARQRLRDAVWREGVAVSRPDLQKRDDFQAVATCGNSGVTRSGRSSTYPSHRVPWASTTPSPRRSPKAM